MLRVLVIVDSWPSEAHPGAVPWLVESTVGLAKAGADVRTVVLQRRFPPARLLTSLRHPTEIPGTVSAWYAESRAGLLHRERTLALSYTSPPRPWSHELWGDWVWAQRRARLVRLAQDFRPDVIVGHFAIPSGAVALRLAQVVGSPCVVHVHGADIRYTAARRERGRRRVARVLGGASLVVANSSSTARSVNALTSPRSMVVLWQGGDVVGRAGDRVHRYRRRVLSAGNLFADKGWAAAALIVRGVLDLGMDVEWVVAGAGEPRDVDSLTRIAVAAGVDGSLSYRGEVSPAAVSELMMESDVFLLPSQIDAYGLVFAEALGAGMVVVGGEEAGAMRDFVAAGAPVLTVGLAGVSGVAARLVGILNDEVVLRAVQEEGQKWAARHLGWDKYRAALVREYAALAAARTSDDS